VKGGTGVCLFYTFAWAIIRLPRQNCIFGNSDRIIRQPYTCACENRFVPKFRLAAECLYPLAQHPAGLLGCIAPKNAFDMHIDLWRLQSSLMIFSGCLFYVTSTILLIIPRFNAPTLSSGIGVKVCPSVYDPDSAIRGGCCGPRYCMHLCRMDAQQDLPLIVAVFLRLMQSPHLQ
jgi:hypothetical protein